MELIEIIKKTILITCVLICIFGAYCIYDDVRTAQQKANEVHNAIVMDDVKLAVKPLSDHFQVQKGTLASYEQALGEIDAWFYDAYLFACEISTKLKNHSPQIKEEDLDADEAALWERLTNIEAQISKSY